MCNGDFTCSFSVCQLVLVCNGGDRRLPKPNRVLPVALMTFSCWSVVKQPIAYLLQGTECWLHSQRNFIQVELSLLCYVKCFHTLFWLFTRLLLIFRVFFCTSLHSYLCWVCPVKTTVIVCGVSWWHSGSICGPEVPGSNPVADTPKSLQFLWACNLQPITLSLLSLAIPSRVGNNEELHGRYSNNWPFPQIISLEPASPGTRSTS